MKTKAAYLVIDAHPRRGSPRIERVTQGWPSLGPGEIAVRCAIEVPDELLPGLTYWLQLDDPAAIAVSAIPVPVEMPADEEGDP